MTFGPFKSPTPDFEKEYYREYAESLGSSNTTSTTFQTKLTLTTSSIPAGKYRIQWTYAYGHGQADRRSEERIYVDSATVLYIVDPEESRGTSFYYPAAGFADITFGSAGTHTIELQYRCVNTSSMVIKEARLEIWRID